MNVTRPSDHLVFGPFQANLKSAELRKNGVRVRIQDLPFRLLGVLASRPGEVVTRQELQKHLWSEDTFVVFEDGLNTAIRKLREALCDNAAEPRYIETIPRHGYRFIAEVEYRNGNSATPTLETPVLADKLVGRTPTTPPPVSLPPTAEELQASVTRRWIARPPAAGTAAAVILLGIVGFWLFGVHSALSFNSRDSVLIADFDNQTGEARLDQALQAAFVVSIEQSQHVNVFPRARLESALQMMGKPAMEHITPSLALEICQREGIHGLIASNITRTGNDYELTAELIDPQTGAAVRSYAEHSNGEDHILSALDAIAADIRRDLGESLYQIKRADRHLPEVTTNSLPALKQYAEAKDLWHRGKYQDAVTSLKSAIQSDPNFAMAHAALGSAYFSYIFHAEAQGREEYEKALALSSRTTERERMIMQTEYAHDLGHVGEADGLFRSYLSRYPDDWHMLSDYAHLLRTHGRQKEALEQYQKILKLAPDDAKTYIEIATTHKTLDELQEALSAYEEAFRLDAHLLTAGDIGREYGGVLVQMGQEQKARQIFSDMLEKADTRERGMRSLALVDLYHGHYADARKRFEQCLTILQGQQSSFSVARVHLWLGYVAEGEGNTSSERRELDEAMKEFNGIGPKVIFGSWVGQAYARAGLLEKAQNIEKTIAPMADARSVEQMGHLHLLQGEIALAQNKPDEAITLLTLASKENSTGLTQEAVARAYQGLGRTKDAVPALEEFVQHQNRAMLWEAQQGWLEAHCALAADYLAQGNRQSAKEALAPLLELWQTADPDLLLAKRARAMSAQLQ